MPNRLSRGPYVGLWALLLAGQIGALYALLPTSAPLALGVAFALQLLKIPLTMARLDDLGYARDDAVLALVPFANIGLWWQALGGTPDDDARERLRSQWVGQISASQAFWMGMQGLFAWTTAGVPIAVLAGTAMALLDAGVPDLLVTLAHGPEQTRETVTQLLIALTLFLALYTVVQIAKASTASRASWLPCFFLPVPLFAWITIRVVDSDNPMVPLLTSSETWQITWVCVAGAALGVLWVEVAEAHHERRRLGLGDAIGRIARRTADVSAPHGAAMLAVLVGMQVIIPGIYYALQFSFVDAAAVRHPDVPALRRSAQLTNGIRRRVFKVYAFGFLVAFVASFLVCPGIEAWAQELSLAEATRRVATTLPSYLLFPLDELSLPSMVVVWSFNLLTAGAARIGLAHMYRERLARAEG